MKHLHTDKHSAETTQYQENVAKTSIENELAGAPQAAGADATNGERGRARVSAQKPAAADAGKRTAGADAASDNATPLLAIRNLSFQYERGFPIFRDVSFDLHPAEVIALLGPNGAGKSTLMNCLANLASPTSGTIELKGRPLESYSARDLAKHVAYVPQQISVAYGYTVREYLVMGAAPRLGMFSAPGAKEYARVDQLIEELGLQKFAKRTLSHLSGGERQRIAIARAIVQDPEIILLDEPTSALDYGNQIRVMKTIRQLTKRGYAVIMTTHNPDQPILLDSKVALLNADGTLAVGLASETLSSELLSRLYGTELHLVHIDEVGRIACVSSKLD